MKNYDLFKYIFPPRPATVSPASGIPTYERMGYIAQPKLNGSCGVLFMDGSTTRLMGRHNDTFKRMILKESDLKSLYRGTGFLVLVGEYMNKSQRDGKGKPFTGFVVFDILVHNGRHLIGSTFAERQALLDSLYVSKPHDEFIDSLGNSMYRAKNFTSDLTAKYESAIKIQMYEGFVLKRPDGKLENGFREANNTMWQLKIRKPTRNYSY